MVTQSRLKKFSFVSLLLTILFVLCHGDLRLPNGVKKSSTDSVNGKQDPCKIDDEECKKDFNGYNAIEQIHQLIDDDQNGNVDITESDEFMRDELQYTEGFERLSIFHGNDKLISIGDLWHAWKKSTVYNWTTEDVVLWLVKHVELPIYADSFKTNSVDGPTLPRLAIADNNYMASVLGVKNAIHRQKISVKAMDLVLFGPPKEKNKFIKDLALILLLVVAFGGVWFALNQQRYAKRHMKKISQRMENLRKAELHLQELQERLNNDESKSAAQESVDDETDSNQKGSRGMVMDGSVEEIERLRLAEEELERVREALQEAEQRNKWTAPSDLQVWLQLTYETEEHYFEMKKKDANNRVMLVKDSCEKLRKKRGAFFGPFRMANDNSMDESDQKVQEAKEALEEVNLLSKDRQRRWKCIEKLCNFGIVDNPGKESLMQRVKNTKGVMGRTPYSMMSPHMPAMNVDQAELDEDLPPGYPGPGPDNASSGYQKGTGVRHRPQNFNKAATYGQFGQTGSQNSDTGSDQLSLQSESISPDQERPVFSLGENSPDVLDGRNSPMRDLHNNNSVVSNGNKFSTLPSSRSMIISDVIGRSNRDSVGNASLPLSATVSEKANSAFSEKRSHSTSSLAKHKVGSRTTEKSQSVEDKPSSALVNGQKVKQKKKLLHAIFSKKSKDKQKAS